MSSSEEPLACAFGPEPLPAVSCAPLFRLATSIDCPPARITRTTNRTVSKVLCFMLATSHHIAARASSAFFYAAVTVASKICVGKFNILLFHHNRFLRHYLREKQCFPFCHFF